MHGGDNPDKTPDSRSVGEPAHLRREFGRRLRAARRALGYTQERMAYALGIRPARYGKYEIGRSEAPFDVLIRIARLAKVDLDYLIAGQSGRLGRRVEPFHEQLSEIVHILPTAAVVFDRHGRLLTCNALYREQFFAGQPRLLKRGTPQEVMVRSWAHGQELSDAEIEVFVRTRLNPPPTPMSSSRLRVGPRSFHVAETIDPEWRLVLINDLNHPAEEKIAAGRTDVDHAPPTSARWRSR
jgi:transcriptional regulator with XRE-family HTH domain